MRDAEPEDQGTGQVRDAVKIATWNVNSIRARLPVTLAWLDQARPDIALLQETKVTEEQFPAEPFEERGYNVAARGEIGGRNGIAILAKRPIEDIRAGLPGGDGDAEARYLEAVVDRTRVASVYVPNGTAVGSERFVYKLAFLDRLRAHVRELLELEEVLVIGGDYNVGPYPIDVFDPQALDGTICYHPAERAKAARAPPPRSVRRVPYRPAAHPGVQLVGLPGPLVAGESGSQDRPPAAVPARGRPTGDMCDRSRAARREGALRPRPGVVRAERRQLARRIASSCSPSVRQDLAGERSSGSARSCPLRPPGSLPMSLGAT
jgi:exodeoxyribonuclease III